MVNIASAFAFFCPFIVLMVSHFPYFSIGYESRVQGFSIELIDRDHSPLSPFYNPLDTHSTRLRAAFHRSMSRINQLHQSLSNKTTFQIKLIPRDAAYLTQIAIGTPPFKILLLVDTGSHVTWIQCKGCSCFKQNTPIFNPDKSSTYKQLVCKSKSCQKALGLHCSSSTHPDICPYDVLYGDLSYTQGVLATDTFIFAASNGQPVFHPKLVFGCGMNNSGEFLNATGIMGLSYGPPSILSQLDLKKFCYCLVPINSKTTSTMKFGSHATISGEGLVSTPLISTYPWYVMSLEAISIGDKRFPMTLGVTGGNIIIDSGTTFSVLPTKLYSMVESELKKSIKSKPSKDPSGVFKLCYSSKFGIKVPEVTYHFVGADVKLSKSNTFTEDFRYALECFAIFPADGVAMFGNLVQKNFQVEYDVGRKIISFAPADCTKF